MCFALHKKEGKEPKCYGCARHRPQLLKNNRLVWALWLRVQTQRRYVGNNGICIGIDYQGLKIVADCMGVELTELVLNKIQALENIMIQEVNKRSG